MRCLLCTSEKLKDLKHQHWQVAFFHCEHCDLIFREPASFPDWGRQKVRYDQHNNSLDDKRYLEYFQQFIVPLKKHLDEAGLRQGLDWGAGPGPALAQELRKLNFEIVNYDPIYFPDMPKGLFDFVTTTEVIEHFQTPFESLSEVLDFVKEKGVFAGMTNFHSGPEHFSSWWYAKDDTHVCFYSEKTFDWIEAKWNLRRLHLRSPIFIFQK